MNIAVFVLVILMVLACLELWRQNITIQSLQEQLHKAINENASLINKSLPVADFQIKLNGNYVLGVDHYRRGRDYVEFNTPMLGHEYSLEKVELFYLGRQLYAKSHEPRLYRSTDYISIRISS